jgi:integrase
MKLSGGRWRIQWTGPDDKVTSWRPGKMPQKAAETITRHIEELVTAALSGATPKPDTATWLGAQSPKIHKKLVKWGLARPRVETGPDLEPVSGPTVAAFIGEYIDRRRGVAGVGPDAVRAYEQDRKSLVAFLGPDKLLADVTAGDADEFKDWLGTPASRPGHPTGFASATISRRLCCASQFFRAAVRKRLIPDNPFADVKRPGQANESRLRFIGREQIDRVMEKCPHWELRLVIALSRFGGLSCPSETLELAWSDIDWERGRIRVPSPKTKRFGKPFREIPIFGSLRPFLEDAWNALDDQPARHVITRYRNKTGSLRMRLAEAIARAGMTPWPRLFHNLRASCETELAATFPLHVVARWLGNTAIVANKHYLSVTDDHFEKAAGKSYAQSYVDRAGRSGQEGTRAAGDCMNSAGFHEYAEKRPSSEQSHSGPAEGVIEIVPSWPRRCRGVDHL